MAERVFTARRLSLSALILHVLAPVAHATTWIVDSRFDPVSGDAMSCAAGHVSDCTLRDAIAAAVTGDTIDIEEPAVYLNNDLELDGSVTIQGSGYSTAIDGQGLNTVFAINAGINVTLANLTIRNGHTAQEGAGIYNRGTLTLRNCTVSGNHAGSRAGGIFNAGTLTLYDSTVSGNYAGLAGGGIYNIGTLTLDRSTVSGNSLSTPVLPMTTTGGGIFNSALSGASLTMTNSTVAGNIAPAPDGRGGGIYNGFGIITITNSTIAGNSASTGSGLITGGTIFPSFQTTMTNTIIADGCAGAPIDRGGNLDSGTSCGLSASSSISNATLNLGPLQDNGGPTWTMLPGFGSAALGAGIDTACAASPVNDVDQRGVPRPQGVNCDSGAVEVVTDRIFADDFDGTPTP